MRLSRLAALAAFACLVVPATAQAEGKALAAGLAGYVYGFPPVIHQLSQATFPVNQLVGIAATARPENKLVVLPNVDTAYTVGRLDLRAEPIVVHVPAIAGRYYSFQLMDAYTNVFGYIGSRTTGTGAGDYAITAPGWVGALPLGVERIESPTPDVLVLGRTLVRSPEDLPAVKQLLGAYSATPLSAPAPRASVVLDEAPVRAPPVLPTGLAFFDRLGEILAADPPPAADAGFLRRRLEPFGIGPGLKTSEAELTAPVRRDLVKAVALGPSRVAAVAAAAQRASARAHAGWTLLDPRTGDAGTDYGLRAIVATVGLWANTPEEATYPMAAADARGRRLDGRHRYVLRFARGQVPPAKAFWSLTMYDAARHLYANALDRYALGDRSTGMKRDADGGLTIDLQHARPAPGRVANWLPSPAGAFTVVLRLYAPARRALDGRWAPPGIRRDR
ncbi:MAG: hypothetical protein JWM73_337 [Solirubrobacterales bacterium]|nr:hypothetical protein [Solirubrobacterales bacterium]